MEEALLYVHPSSFEGCRSRLELVLEERHRSSRECTAQFRVTRRDSNYSGSQSSTKGGAMETAFRNRSWTVDSKRSSGPICQWSSSPWEGIRLVFDANSCTIASNVITNRIVNQWNGLPRTAVASTFTNSSKTTTTWDRIVLRDYAQSVGAHVRPTRLKFTRTKQTTPT